MADTFKRRPHLIFFCLAALQALSIIPLTTLWAVGGSVIPGWSLAAWHAHEMIFGFALAVMGGYFAGKYEPRQTALLVTSWVLARVVVLTAGGTGASLFAALYPALLFVFAGMPILKAAKTRRNAAFGYILAALALVDLAFLAATSMGLVSQGQSVGRVGLLLIVMMAFAMGGRLTGAATSGAHQALGQKIEGVAHISLERAGLFLLMGLAAVLLAGLPALWISVLSLGLAGVTGLRLWRWQVWKLRDPAVLCLHVGFAWLAVGFLLLAFEPFLPGLGLGDVLHALTIGAVGTFTLSVMTRVILQKTRKKIIFPSAVLVAIGAVNLAAICRIIVFATGQNVGLLIVAASAWTLAWALFIVFALSHLRHRSATLDG